MSFAGYNLYKNSGIDWIDVIPNHWSAIRLRNICEIKKRIVGELGHEILSITQKGIRVKDTESNDGQISSDYSKYQFVEPGDFAMNHMDLLTGWVDISGFRGVTSPDYRVFSVRDASVISPRFLLSVMQMGYSDKIWYAYGQGSSQLGRWRLPTEQFKDLAIPLPSVSEQIAIASFLDHETSKIDALIAEQERLIELLKEKRQAVISHAVTKGLDPKVKMKPSGIEWLGDVPEHWEVYRLKTLAKPKTSITYGIVQAGPDIEGGIPYIRTSDMSGDFLPESGYLRTTADIDASYARSKVIPGDLVIAIRATLGKALIVPEYLSGANLTQGTAKVSPGHLISSQFLLWAFNSSYNQVSIDYVAKGTTFREITLDALRKLKIATPPLDEQHRIESYLSDRIKDFDVMICDATSTIGLLSERRSALISAAVTGQIDVRHYASTSAA